MAEKKVIALKVKVDTSEAIPEIEEIKVQIDELKKANAKMAEELKQGFKAAEQGTKGLGSSIGSLIKSLGIIGVAMKVFEFMKDLLLKNQKVLDAVNVATTALEILFNKLFEAVEPIGDAMKSAFEDPMKAIVSLKDFIVERFMIAMKGFGDQFIALGSIIESALEFDWDGVTKGAEDFGDALLQTFTATTKAERQGLIDSVKDFAKEVATATVNAVDQASALTALRNELELLEAGQKKVQLTYQRDAELQRQRRDDIRLTLDERIEANKELGKTLDKQIQVEQVLADKRLALAIQERDLLGANTERKAAVLMAEGEIADLQERIAGQRSEQLTNEAALEKELFDIQQELRVATLDAREKELEELDIYYETLEEKARIAGESIEEIQAKNLEERAKLEDKFRQEDIKKEQQAAKIRIDAAQKEADAKLSIASSVAGSLGSIVQSLGNQSKASVAIQKTLAIAQIAIDTARSISSAISAATAAAAATGPGAVVATPVFIATQIATVLAAVGQAVAILNSTPGGGSASVPSVSVSQTSAAPPSFNPVTTNTTELGGTEQAELAPIQAFVVETQLTGSQENVSQIQGQAEFG